ncbi:MAG: creatininase family protein [Burkholderiales bacterium]|nr:creatininase family protein [Burkholderiales bacterium]
MRMRRAACALTLTIGAWATGFAAPPEVALEAMTSTELRDAIAAGSTTVLLPIGGTEQNGAHLVLGKHNVRVRVLSERIARELGHTVVAPVMAYVPEGAIDPPSAHMRFAGTISVPEKAFEAVLESAAASLARHGFKDIVLLGDHGGYQASLARVAARWNPAAHRGARLHALGEYYRASSDGFNAWLKNHGHDAAEIGQHAGLADTALALAADPALVRREMLARAPSEGVSGDPRRATLELGQSGLDQIVRASVAAIRARLQKP